MRDTLRNQKRAQEIAKKIYPNAVWIGAPEFDPRMSNYTVPVDEGPDEGITHHIVDLDETGAKTERLDVTKPNLAQVKEMSDASAKRLLELMQEYFKTYTSEDSCRMTCADLIMDLEESL